MAVLGKIREKSIFLIIIIALALFAFVMTGVFKNLTGPEEPSNVIANIDGEEVGRSDFAQRVQNFENNSRGDVNTSQAVNQVWNSTLRSVLLKKQFEDLGLEIGDEQLNSVIRQQFSGNPAFQNEAGMFDINLFRRNIANLKNTAPQRYQQFKTMEDNMVRQAKANAYFSLIQAGMTTNESEARQIYKMDNDNVSFDFVQLPYSQAGDVDISKSDIKSYMKSHKDQYQIEENRDIQYVFFKEKASDKDEEMAREKLAKMTEDHEEYDPATNGKKTVDGFKNTTDYEDFLVRNSDLPLQDKYLFADQISSKIPDSLSAMSKGDLYGPYKENNYWKYTKVADIKKVPDSVDAKRIVVSYKSMQNRQQSQVTRSKEEAKQLADSLVRVIEKDTAQFAGVAADFSDDPQAATNGGDLGWISYRDIPKDSEISDFLFNNESGAVDVIESQFGYQVVMVKETRNTQKAVKLATLARKINPSEATQNDLFTKTIKFQKSANADKGFAKTAEEHDKEVRPVKGIESMQANIPGLDNQREIVQWTFNKKTKTGDVKRFETSEGYAIVQLTDKNKAGLMSVENASGKITPILRKKRQAEKLEKKMKGKSLNSIASSNSVEVEKAQLVSLKDPTIAGAGSEPRVVGTAFGLDKGATSKPITGEDGVFVIKVTGKKEAQELNDYRSIAQRNTQQQNQQMRSQLIEALKNNAEIEDNRSEFY